MKFTVTSVKDWDFEEKVEIDSMEDLKKLYDRFGYSLVIDFDEATITIYDSYLD